MKPVHLEVLAPMLSTSEMGFHGSSVVLDCLGLKRIHRRDAVSEYPEDWKQAVDYLASWIRETANLYRHRIQIRVIDAQSPLGLWKQIRHRLFRFPAFIVDKRLTYIGWDPQELETLIDRRIHSYRS